MGALAIMPAGTKSVDKPAADGWQNWSKSLPPQKAKIIVPKNATALATLIQTTKGGVRPVGAGHSWSSLVPCNGAIVRLDNFDGVDQINATEKTAWLGAGARLRDLSPQLTRQGARLF